MESLEPRWVFSAAPIVGGECISLPDVAPAEGEFVASLPIVGPAYPVVPNYSTQLDKQLPPPPQQLTTPAAFEQVFAEVADKAEGEGEDKGEDVFHIEMNSIASGPGRWTFTGTVGTLAGHSGAQVVFGGLLAGHTATLNQYGQFSYTHFFGPGIFGTVTGKGVDSSGRETNIDSEFILT
jgi:hypothetical protein